MNYKHYYSVKPFIPRWLQLALRRRLVSFQRKRYESAWPIDGEAGTPPPSWSGWPGNKQFALVLTHDVETGRGQEKCLAVAFLEKTLGFRSSFNFVPLRYPGFPELHNYLIENGFEVGVHGLYHDGKYYSSRTIFEKRAAKINDYLKEWQAVGFRTPSMDHNLEWIHDLHVKYDSSTFDTDPFEPNPEGMKTIFPFLVSAGENGKGYIELPYTLPQDFTLFVIMKEKNIDIWKKKLKWVAEHNGMALVITHPDYMNFDLPRPSSEQYPWHYYSEFLQHVKDEYGGRYWHVLPKEMASFWSENLKGNNDNLARAV